MNDQQINRKLALAIGWKPWQICPNNINTTTNVLWFGCWCVFHYLDWATISPIAQRYDCFPYVYEGAWRTRCHDWMRIADTPQKAIALAVIAAHEAGVLK